MAELSAPAVLHLTAAVGGGVDRYIRDAAATTARRHFIWHAGDAIDVIEDVAARAFVPLRDVIRNAHAASALDAWQRAERIGLIHLHGVDRAVRDRLALTDAALPAIATLHDVAFLAPRAFEANAMPVRDAAWIAEIETALTRVATLVVPSAFIRREAERAFPAKTLVDIAPGIAPPVQTARSPQPAADFIERAPRHVVAVVGAIGPHKGSALVDTIARELAGTGIGLVVIGYTSERILRGWVGDYYVHGPYLDADLPALLPAYRVELALFPNRLPESFSYTLSEAWAARIPAIVPDAGALGERVAYHGGGWRLAAAFDATDASALIRHLFRADGEIERARVKSQIDPFDADRIPTLASMSRALDRLYERFAVPPQGASGVAPAEALTPLLAANLDGFAFRAELLHLAEDLDNARTAIAALQRDLARTQEWARKAEANGDAWAAKLQRDIEALQREVHLRDDVLSHLPTIVRAWLLKRARRDGR